MKRPWRFIAVLPILVLGDASASESERFESDVLLCRGPFTITYRESTAPKKGATYEEGTHITHRILNPRYAVAEAEIMLDRGTAYGKVGLGLDLERSQCGWVRGKNPSVGRVTMSGEWLATPVRSIKETPDGKQTVSYDLPLTRVTHSAHTLFTFRVARQSGTPSDQGMIVDVIAEPQISTDAKFKKP